MEDGEENAAHLNRGALDHRARILGGKLQEMGLEGERALLLYPPGLEYVVGFTGCLYSKVIAVPAYPPDPYRLERTLPRLLAIIKNCQAKLILTTQEIVSMRDFFTSQFPEFAQIPWLASDALEESYADAWKEPNLTGESLAFLQYTSGSTGDPRGVKLTHGNLIHNLGLIINGFGLLRERDIGVCWLPPYHDMGLIGGILVPMIGGGENCLMSPLHFLHKPFRWLKAISKSGRAVVSGGPNFAFDLCIRKITPAQRETLDFSHWKVVYTGAEPIRNDVLERFADTFSPCGFDKKAFIPCYGLAEATLMVSGSRQSQCYRTFRGGNATLVSCGAPVPDQEIMIVDPQTLESVKDEEAGEIWVKGPSVAKGYWDHQEVSASIFNNFPRGSKEGPFLRTGDLGFLHEGELFITGRIKDLIILFGMNHYPQDLERTMEECHPALRPGCGAAFSVPIDGEEQLILVQELAKESYQESKNINFAEVVAKVREAVATRHGVEIYTLALIAPSSIAKTSSGKISRHFCKLDFQRNLLKTVYLWKRQESALAPKS